MVEAKEAEIAALRAGQQAMGAQVEALRAEIAELRARLGANPRNSSRPPSSEGLAKPSPRSLRKKTGRRPGRPAGQPGATLEMADAPDQVIRHEPASCRSCGAGLAGAQEAAIQRRQVVGLPAVKVAVTEHQLVSRRCACGTVTCGSAPAGVSAPVQYGPVLSGIGVYLWHGQFLSRGRTCQAMAQLFGVPVSPGAVTAMVARIAGAVGPVLGRVREAIAAAPLAHFDETGFRVAGRLAWVHSASTDEFSLITVHPRRGTEGMDAAGVLPGFRGIACHDAWAPYDTYGGVAGHALCNAHVLRELAGAAENGTSADAQWAGQAADALLALKDAVQRALAGGQAALDPVFLDRHSHLLRSAALVGARANAGRRTKIEKKAYALARRLTGREGDYLRFAHDFTVAFDNNAAEREIRMAKLRIKVSGCMRSLTGAGQFCAVRSYLATAAKHGIGALDALIRAAEARPWLPDTS